MRWSFLVSIIPSLILSQISELDILKIIKKSIELSCAEYLHTRGVCEPSVHVFKPGKTMIRYRISTGVQARNLTQLLFSVISRKFERLAKKHYKKKSVSISFFSDGAIITQVSRFEADILVSLFPNRLIETEVQP